MSEERTFRSWFAAVAALCLCAVSAVLLWTLPRLTRERDTGFTTARDSAGFHVARSSTPALQPGDRILAINGDSRFSSIDPSIPLRQSQPGEIYSITISRGGPPLTLQLRVTDRPTRQQLPAFGLEVLWSLAFAALALFGYRARATSVTVRWMSLCTISMAFILMEAAMNNPLYFGWFNVWYFDILAAFATLVHIPIYLFLEYFPIPLPASPLWTRLRRISIGASLIRFTAVLPYVLLRGMSGELRLSQGNADWMRAILPIVLVTDAVRIILVAALAVRMWRSLQPGANRRRLGWVIIPIGIHVLIAGAGNMLFYAGSVSYAANSVMVYATMGVSPATIFYAIGRHRVMGISLVIRRSLQYLLARPALEALLLFPLIWVVARAALEPARSVSELASPVWLYAALTIAAAAGLLFRARLLLWLDRRFFREDWDSERILTQLVDETRSARPFPELLSLAKQRIDDALHPGAARIIFGVPFLQDCPQALEMLRSGETLAAPFPLPAEESEHLAAAGIDLAIPALGENASLSGVILLGEKRSQLPWLARDLHFLRSVATQLAIAHRAHKLTMERAHAIAEERIRIARDLHDTLSQGFAGIKMHLDSLEETTRTDTDQARWHLEQARSLAATSLVEAARSVIERATGSSESLFTRVREIVHQMSGSIPIDLRTAQLPETVVSSDVAQGIFRIAQESLTNAVRHSGATRIDIELSLGLTDAFLTITDDGRGFDARATPAGHYGLKGMRERAAALDGSLVVESSPQSGTRIHAQIPVTRRRP